MPFHRHLMKLQVLTGSALLALTRPAFALNILLSNDDGLTSNLKALYDALKAEGHDVVAKTPTPRCKCAP